ncbi:MAG: nucleotidyltransferase domain-containing protein [Candidatus Aerophobetes bacterium]|nr:nucleotidyltransferase domain-containing protein [Candidatus Aerophobetes bacterium]
MNKDRVIAKFMRDSNNLKENIEEIYLFGSRVREEERPDSDYDLLIVVNRAGREFREKIYEVVLDILLETGKLLSLKILSSEEFRKLSKLRTPFMENILKEGIKIG